MEIRCNKSRAEVAWALAQDLKSLEKGLRQGSFMEDGYAVLRPEDIPGFQAEWGASNHPFGPEAWKGLRVDWELSAPTSESSVHHGARLPKNGRAVLDCGGFSVVLRQWITDHGWWDWVWDPIAIVAVP